MTGSGDATHHTSAAAPGTDARMRPASWVGSRIRESFSDWLALVRPRQWIKNGFVLAPLLFSGRAFDLQAVTAGFSTFIAFCLLASAGYILNDMIDREADRLHPAKRRRPLASGRVKSGYAIALAAGLSALGLVTAFTVSPSLGTVGLSYLLLAVAYSVRLKHLIILDVFAIATFYLMRLIGGSVAIDVRPSIWLLICGGLLALYLAFAKRRHELLILGGTSSNHRTVLRDYSPVFVDQMSVVLLSVTIVAYLMYTISSETSARVGSDLLVYSTVFVLYGVFRYMYLVHRRGAGGNPTETLLTDRALLLAVAGWLTYCGWIVYRPL